MNINMLLIQANADSGSPIQKILEGFQSSYSIRIFSDARKCIRFLEKGSTEAPQVLFLNLGEKNRACVQAINSVRKTRKIIDMSIAVYDSNNVIDQDEAFLAGGNVYIKKENDSIELARVLKKVMRTDYLYSCSNLNRESYLISV